MAKISTLLQERFLKKEKTKMEELAEKSSQGSLTSFSGIFGAAKVSDKEKDVLHALLKKYAHDQAECERDYQELLAIIAEIKSINNQAVLLHGERVKKAQEILKSYKEGAFTAWLYATYGNRQTPYNFLQYYEFYSALPKALHALLETMPRQAIYALASRKGAVEKKEEIVRSYKGETKQELLNLIRTHFPLDEKDRRRENLGDAAINSLQKLISYFCTNEHSVTARQKKILMKQLTHLHSLIQECKINETS